MSTRVFDVGQAPTYGSAWSTAGGAINEGLSSVLGYYQQYQQQKRFEAQQAQDAKFKAQEMAERAENNKAIREDREDRRNQVRAAEWEKNAPLMTEDQAMQLPDYTETALAPTQPTAEQMGAAPDTGGAAKPLAPPTETKKLLRSKKFGDYTGFADFGGKQAAAQKKQERIDSGQAVTATPELTATLDKLGLGHYEDVVPATIMGLYRQHMSDTQADERLVSSERIANARLNATLNRKSSSDLKAEKDDATNEMINSIEPGKPETIPMQYRDLVVAASEGRTVQPRAGTNVNLMEQMAFRFNPQMDRGNIAARQALRKDLVKGSQTTRGGQITSLNTLSSHLDSLERASEELGGTGFSSVNWATQKLTPSYARTSIAKFEEKAKAVTEEYIRALKGASPTSVELQAMDALSDATLAPAERQSRISALKELAEGRANAQEDAWVAAFGQPSVKAGSPMFAGGWIYDTNTDRWRLPKRGEKPTVAGKPAASGGGDSLGVR